MKLCFGSFAKAILQNKKPKRTNIVVVELLLGLITDNMEIRNKRGEAFTVTDKIASQYLNCKEPILTGIANASYEPDIVSAAPAFFEDVVLPEIEPSLLNNLISDICNIVKSDLDIADAQKESFIRLADSNCVVDFLAQVFLYALKMNNKVSLISEEAKNDSLIKQALDDMDTLETLLRSYPQPVARALPAEPTEDELEYVRALLDVYTEELKAPSPVQVGDLDMHPEYKKDLCQHRKNYYAAEAIREGTKDSFGDVGEDNFTLLKDEVYDQIYATYRQHFDSSMERVNAVMDRAALSPIERCRLLSKLNWISSREKKGVCHFLVKDGEISWVKK